MGHKDAVVRDPLGEQHRRVECRRVADEDVGRPVKEEEMARPVRHGGFIERQRLEEAGLESGAEFLGEAEDHLRRWLGLGKIQNPIVSRLVSKHSYGAVRSRQRLATAKVGSLSMCGRYTLKSRADVVAGVFGVPVPSKYLRGEDSLLSIVQMPKGVPVATFAIGEAGAANAALHVIAGLALHDADLSKRLAEFRAKQSDTARSMNLPGY